MKKSIFAASILGLTAFFFAACSQKEVRPESYPAAPVAVAPEPVTIKTDLAHFDYDSAVLRPRGKAMLRSGANELKSNPNLVVEIQGYCDERGTEAYNLALGQRRAESAKNYLVRLGVESERINTQSFGEGRPLDRRSNEDAWAKNRRIVLIQTLRKQMALR